MSLCFKLLPMKRGCKGRAPSFLTSLFPHMSGAEGVTCGNAALRALESEGVLCSGWDHRGCPASFPMFSPANENTGKRHVPISEARRHGDLRKSVSKYQRQGHGLSGRGREGRGRGVEPTSLQPSEIFQTCPGGDEEQHLLPATCASFRLNPSLGFKSSFIFIF